MPPRRPAAQPTEYVDDSNPQAAMAEASREAEAVQEREPDSTDDGTYAVAPEDQAYAEEVDAAEEFEEAAQEVPEYESPFGVWSADTAGEKGFKMLLYGPSGVGKTRMSATFPRPLFLDLEDGLRTTVRVKPVLRYPADPRQQIASLDQVKTFYSLVKRDPNPQYETIVIDSLNELQLLVMKNVLSRFDANRQYEDQPTMADYGKVIRDFTSIIRLFLKLPYHIIFTAVETPREYPEQQVFPQFIGKKTGPDVQRMMEMIGYCHVVNGSGGESRHVVSFHQSPLWVAKDRFGVASPEIPNTYEALVGTASI